MTRKLLLIEFDDVTAGFLNAYVSHERVHELPTAEELGRVALEASKPTVVWRGDGTSFTVAQTDQRIGQTILDTLTKRTTNWRNNEQTIPFSR